MLLFAIRLILVFLGGACLGSIVNWAIYTFAWNSRPISPWAQVSEGMARRTRRDRVPILGWFQLNREAAIFGPRYWWRPVVLEIGTGIALAALYWWEIERLELIQGQLGSVLIVPPAWTVHWQFFSHAVLLGLMLAASFIDIDEKIIPDAITVPGTLLGLLFATLVPLSLLPNVMPRQMPPPANGVPAVQLLLRNGGPAVDPNGDKLWLEPTTAVAPTDWPPTWGAPRTWQSLAVGVDCYWLWCFALAPRIWRGSRGPIFALRLICVRLQREFARPPMQLLIVSGTLFIVCVWWFGVQSWAGLLTALVGLAGGGGLVWAVRLIGSAALRREAMGFGDVTLMMMLGTFIGWQGCLIAFFLSPPLAVLIGITQFVLRRDDVIPFGPFLCLGAAFVVVEWAPIWEWGRQLFGAGLLVPAALVVCLVLLGLMLGVWAQIKRFFFGDGDTD
jgi:prepilin signal peptidase PulO-like enzyme (type II secretory pathway)